MNGSDRVTIIWADDAIRNTWLQVVVLPTASTGLTAPQLFYFGNAIGDSGDNTTKAWVNASDVTMTRGQPYVPGDLAPITAATDFNRDRLVNATDQLIAYSHLTALQGALQLIKPDGAFGVATVSGRFVFYNNSSFDGNDPGASTSDDGSVAPDKSALLPGAKATFANYTSYNQGINGVMVDVAGLEGTPTADDFEFRVGNNNSPAGWLPAPAPASITVRPGAGVGDSDRITIIWPDGSIKNEWLQVTVKPSGRTGLAIDDVFYFGNKVGETGDSANFAFVNASDITRVRLGIGAGAAAITSPLDMNRDGVIDITDKDITQNSAGSILLIKPPLPNVPPPVVVPDPIALAPEAAYTDFANTSGLGSQGAAVVGRAVFYNNSSFDRNNPAPGPADDGAIAADKSPLLPGDTATLANITNYSRGINGIMIDVLGLASTPVLADFSFKIGTSADPTTWVNAPRRRRSWCVRVSARRVGPNHAHLARQLDPEHVAASDGQGDLRHRPADGRRILLRQPDRRFR